MFTLAVGLLLQALAHTAVQADSASMLNRARADQAAFERTRRDHLRAVFGGSSDHCDERIGDHCFTYGDPNDVWTPPPEPDEVRAARDSLVAVLSVAARLMPANHWLAGQRVRYLVEAQAASSARAAAADCRPQGAWWCEALAGYAAHAAEDFVGAEAAYDRALAGLGEEQRCRWTDIAVLLPNVPKDAYRGRECSQRDSLERRFWWLADPL